MSKNRLQIRAYIEDVTKERFEMVARMKNIHVNDLFEQAVDRYLSQELVSDLERQTYRRKLISAKVISYKNAMREALDGEILNNLVEILVKNYIYKRQHKNTLYADFDELEFFKLLDELKDVDKNAFEIILVFMRDFGNTRNRYRVRQAKL